MNSERPARARPPECDYFLPPFHLTHFFICLISLPQRSCERLELGPQLHVLAWTQMRGEQPHMEGPPQAPYLIMPYQLPLSSQVQLQVTKSSSSSALQILLQKTPVSKLPLSFSPCPPERSLIGLSSNFGVWGDAGVRWLRVRAGGGIRWAQHITHMFPVHPPRLCPRTA